MIFKLSIAQSEDEGRRPASPITSFPFAASYSIAFRFVLENITGSPSPQRDEWHNTAVDEYKHANPLFLLSIQKSSPTRKIRTTALGNIATHGLLEFEDHLASVMLRRIARGAMTGVIVATNPSNSPCVMWHRPVDCHSSVGRILLPKYPANPAAMDYTMHNSAITFTHGTLPNRSPRH